MAIRRNFFNVTAQRIEDMGKRLTRRHHLKEPSLAGKPDLSTLSVVNIDLYMKPPQDSPLCIPERQAEDVEPSVSAIGATMAALNIVRMPLFMCLHQSGYRALAVVRVNDIGGLPTLQIVKRHSKVFERWSVEALNLTGRRCDGNRDRNAFDNLAEKDIDRMAGFLSSYVILVNCGGGGSLPAFFHAPRMLQTRRNVYDTLVSAQVRRARTPLNS